MDVIKFKLLLVIYYIVQKVKNYYIDSAIKNNDSKTLIVKSYIQAIDNVLQKLRNINKEIL